MERLTKLEAQVFAKVCELIDRDGVGFVDELVWPDRYQLAGVLGALEKKGLVGTDAIDGPMNDNAGRLQLDVTDKGEEAWGSVKAEKRSNDPAHAYTGKLAEICGILDDLKSYHADVETHCDPSSIDWGDVGDLVWTLSQLKAVRDRAFGLGEYAPEEDK